MDWAHLDLNAAIWSLPAAATKTRSAHSIHLPTGALAILRRRHRDAKKPHAGLALPSAKAQAELTTFTAMKRTLKAEMAREEAEIAANVRRPVQPLPAWTFHDFRRAFASACAEAGVAESVADAILSHSQSATRGGVLGVYQRATRWPEQVKAMDHWGLLLAAAIDGEDEAAKSVSLRENESDTAVVAA